MPIVTNNPTAGRYELALEGGLAFANYKKKEGKLLITHVKVPESLRGKGAATQLMDGVVADAKAKGLEIVPICPFAVEYLKRHPQ